MLEGIEIIETMVNPKMPLAMAIIMTVLCIVMASFLVFGWIAASKGKKEMDHYGDWSPTVTFILDLVLVIMCCAVPFSLWNQYKTPITTYRVSIDESVSLVEFNDRYEIISQDGNEYIIAEKSAN